MPNGRMTMRGSFAASILLAASLAGAPGSAQTGTGAEADDDPYACNFREDYYSCCPNWNSCTQFYIDAPLPPPEPVKPTESPEE